MRDVLTRSRAPVNVYAGPVLRIPTNSEVRARVDRLELPWNDFGIDPYGVSKDALAVWFSAMHPLYRHYFSVESHGLEHVPRQGRVMLVGNHSGGFALDGMMTICSQFFDTEPPRLAQAMVEKFMNKVPFGSQISSRLGHLTGLPEHAERLLADERMLMVFPEGMKGTAKLFRERYTLVQFGSGFMRLAMKMKCPVVPFAFMGGGEAVPTISNARTLGRLLGVPYIPITPWGLAVPIPAKLEVYYSPAMTFDGKGTEEDEVISANVEQVKDRIASLIDIGRKRRLGEIPALPRGSK